MKPERTGKSEKWQAALGYWNEWKNSVNIAKAKLMSKYGDFEHAVAQARIEDVVNDKGSSSEVIDIIVNDEQWLKWQIEQELKNIADDFIAKELGSNVDADIHDNFVSLWINSISPFFDVDIIEERKSQDNMAFESKLTEGRIIEIKSELKGDKDIRMWNSVSWYHDTIDHREVAKYLQKIEWPFTKEMAKRHGGGRPSQKDTLETESVICAILKDKQGLSHKEINQIFQWAEPEPWSVEKQEYMKKKASQTALSRVRLGRKILGYSK